MPRATYVKTDKGVVITSTDGPLMYGGTPWPIAKTWSGTEETLDAMRAENPLVEFVEVQPDSK